MRLQLERLSRGGGTRLRRRRPEIEETPEDMRGIVPLMPNRASSCARASGEKILIVWSIPETASNGS